MPTNVAKELKTIRDFIRFAMSRFEESKIYFGHGTDNSWDEAIYLVLHALHLPCSLDKPILDAAVTASEKILILKIINRRIKERIPAAYLTNKAWFAGLEFYVDKHVLIPRSPLAEVIQKRFVPWIDPDKVKRILDLGTGSGCIAISCAYAFPNAEIDAIDNSNEALKIAAINCKNHGVDERVHLIKSNLFSAVGNKTYDIIISNPPYVGKKEMGLLPKEYQHEPSCALFAGKNGDEIIEQIVEQASFYLSEHGILVVEVGNSKPQVLHKYSNLPFVWLDFEHGDAEVFLLMLEQLKK